MRYSLVTNIYGSKSEKRYRKGESKLKKTVREKSPDDDILPK